MSRRLRRPPKLKRAGTVRPQPQRLCGFTIPCRCPYCDTLATSSRRLPRREHFLCCNNQRRCFGCPSSVIKPPLLWVVFLSLNPPADVEDAVAVSTSSALSPQPQPNPETLMAAGGFTDALCHLCRRPGVRKSFHRSKAELATGSQMTPPDLAALKEPSARVSSASLRCYERRASTPYGMRSRC